MERIGSEVSAVLFDFDGTIRHSRPRGIDVFHKFAIELGVSFPENVRISAERWSHKYFAMSEELREDVLSTGSTLGDGFWLKYARRHLEILGAPEDYLEELAVIITEKMETAYNPENYVAEDVVPTLKDLKERGYPLALISNRSQSIKSLLEELGLDVFFMLTLTAGAVGYWKPDPKLFQHAIHLLELDPSKTLYIGDNYYADVLGSRAADLIPVLMDPLGIYPSPGCPVIRTISDLQGLLNQENL
jgi:HAD superfamily hydrolase (TIGR01662 family)